MRPTLGRTADPMGRRVPLPYPHPIRRAVALAAVLTLVWGGTAASAEPDPAAQRREVQRQKADAASKVDVLKASDAQLESALNDLERNIRGQEARAASARQAAAAAADELQRSKASEARTAEALSTLRSTMKSVAVDSYIQGPSRQITLVTEATSLSDLSTKQYFLSVTANKSADTADELRATTEDLEIKRQSAERAATKASARRKAMDADLQGLKAAEDAKQRVADSVEARLEQSLAEVVSLDAIDQKLAGQIAERQRRLAAAVAARRRTTSDAPRASRASAPIRTSGSISLTTVRGITVASEIAGNLEALLEAASADGFNLSGGGYRSSDGQIAARQANCGTSNYAIYEMPASSCSPPTARPGQSMHEQGLAIDFTSNGSLIQGRSNPAFGWLARNAGRFGLANLPREPWHWSTNGN